MVAIVSGNSLGLNLTSSGVLGGQGVWGDPKMGQGGEQVYVNAATGNLVMQQLQDHLVGSGLDVNSVLTYNSLGLANDDNGDNFSIGRVPGQMVLSSGTLNAAGSTLTRTAFDGSQSVFTWDATSSRYVAVNGAGAFDTVTYASSRYTWVDGATQSKETYDGATGNLLTRVDPAGNTLTFGYTGSMLTSVTDANGETVTYVYSGSLLQQIKAPVTTWVNGTATTSVQPVVTYTYDGSNRLASVIVDLSPDGSIADGKVYTTSYTYDGASKRVKTVTQSDGTALTFVYDGSNRVYTITDALGNVTTYTYDTGNRKTSVLANGQTTVYAYDAGGKLLSVTAPAVNGASAVAQFTYSVEGQLIAQTDADGRTVSMAYDAAGNQVSMLDSGGNLTTRVFDTQNRLLTETRSMACTPALVASGMTVSGGNVTKSSSSVNWDGSVRSANSITGAATVAFTATSTATNVMVGLNADPDTDTGYGSIDYALYLNGGTLAVMINGTWGPSGIDTYVTGDRFSVTYDGNSHVNFLKNGKIFYSLAVTPTQPLFVDSCFYQTGSGVGNLTFSAGVPGAPTFVSAAGMAISGGDVTKTRTINDWDSAVRSVAGYLGASTASFTATSNSTYLMVGLNSDPDQDASYTSLDYALYLEGSNLKVYASNTVVMNSIGSFVAGDRLGVSYDGNGHVNFLKNGQVLYTINDRPTKPLFLDTSFCTPGAGVSNLTFAPGAAVDQTLLNTAGMSITGTAATKISGGDAWNAGFRSAAGINGAATVSFTATSADKNLMVGLNGDPDVDADYHSIDYALFLHSGALHVFASGTDIADLAYTYVQGDRFSVSYDGKGHVNFFKNAQAIYSLVAVPGQALFADSSFYQVGGGVSNVSFTSDAPAAPAFVSTAGMTVNGGTVTKTSAATSWDAGVRSGASVTGAAVVGFTATSTATHVMVGLNPDPETDSGYGSIDYALYLDSGALRIFNNGNNLVNSVGSYVAGDRLAVVYDGAGHVNFLKNGQSLYTMAATPTQPLYADSSFYETGASVGNLSFAGGVQDAPAFVNTSGVVIAGGDIVKVSGTTGWESGARSGSSILGAATVSCTAVSSSSRLMIGLNSDPDTDADYGSIDYALFLNQGSLCVFTGGTYLAPINTGYVAGDRLSVSYDGAGHVNFLKNGQVLYSMAASPTQALYADTSFYDSQASVGDLAFFAPSPDLVSRNVYSADGKGLLRFTISPEGRVSEFGYNAQGQLASTTVYDSGVFATAGLRAGDTPTEAMMVSWRSAQDLTQTQRTDFQHDSRQQISATVAYAKTNADGTGVTSTGATTTYVNDPSGRLLQSIKPGSATYTYVPDGLGRVLLANDSVNRSTTTAYTDATGTIAVTYANNLVTTTTLDKAGRVTSTTSAYGGNSLSKGTVDYDALGNVLRTTDLTGVSVWYLYDAMSRKVAAIDGTGALTEYVYDPAGQVTETIAYAARVNTASLVDGNGKPNNPSLASVRPAFNAQTDQRSWAIYDAAGHLSQSISATGTVTQYAYDGAGRATAVCTFAKAIDVSALTGAPAFQFVASSTGDRITRSYYDRDGHVAGMLDPDGYLTVYQYDAAGQRTVTLKYATISPAATAQSTLAQLVPVSSPNDQRAVTLYSMDGLIVGQIDPLGYLTQTFYTARHVVDHVTRYATSIGNTVPAGSSVDAIKPAPSAADTTTSYLYDAVDRVTSKTDPAGIVTIYTYDAKTDELLSTTMGSGRADATTTQTRYDAMGRAIAVLDGVGSALITNGMSQAQIDAIWAAHSTSVVYDLGGRKASTKDALGNVTLYFYDGDGQLRYTVDPLNNVKELRYDAFGHVTTTIAYASAINGSGIGSGGLITTVLSNAVSAASNASKDLVTRAAYDASGRRVFAVDASGNVTQTSYDVFGQIVARTEYATPIDLPTAGSVDGKTVTLSGNYGWVTPTVYGAIDTTHTYTVTARLRQVSGSGTVFVGVVTKDANGNVITNAGVNGSYAYCAANNVTLTPDQGWVTFTGTISGTQVTVAGGTSASNKFYAGSTQASPLILYNYFDTNGDPGRDIEIDSLVLTDNTTGAVLNVDPSMGLGGSSLSTNGTVDGATSSYTASLSADQIATRLRIDKGHDRTSRFAYDADGRQVFAVDAAGGVTQSSYDAQGNIVARTEYATPIDLPTAGSVDGKTVTLSGNYGWVTPTVYGAIDTTHTYTVTARLRQVSGSGAVFVGVVTKDANGNIITNAGVNGSYAYCAANNVTLTPDQGWVTFTGTISGTQVTVAGGTSASNKFYAGSTQASPLILYNYFDTNGDPGRDIEIDSLVLTDNTTGAVLNVDPSMALGASSLSTNGMVDGATSGYTASLSADQIATRLRIDKTKDRTTRYAYDQDGRQVFVVDAAGAVTQSAYDAFGNVVSRTQYATPIALPTAGSADGRTVTLSGDNGHIESATFAPVDTTHTYTVTARVRQLSGTGSVYVGVSSKDASGNYLTNPSGGAYSYCAAINYLLTPDLGWVTLSGTISGSYTPGPGVYDPSKFFAGTAKAAPLVLYNYYGSNGDPGRDFEIDSLTLTDNATGAVLNVDPTMATGAGSLTIISGGVDNVASTASATLTADQIRARLRPVTTSDRTVTNEYDADGRVVWSADALGHATRMVYDALGRPVYVVAPDGAVTRNDYDADNRVVRSTTFANKLSASDFASLPHAANAGQLATLTQALASPGKDAVQARQYDSLDRVTFTMDGTGAVSKTCYDADNNVVDTISYATKIDPATWSSTTAPSVTADPLHDRHVHASYDAFGNVIAQSDGTGAVVVNTYDADGRLTDRVSYANRIAANSWTTGLLPTVSADATRDIRERYVYDALGQLAYSADGLGAVTAYAYDGGGRVTRKTSLATLATAGQALNAVAVNTTLDRTELFVYNAFGQQAWHADATGALTYTCYDADGQATKTIQYAQQTPGSVPASTAALPVGASDRVTSARYNAFGQATYIVDGLNRVSLTTYDQAGHTLATTRYAATVAAGTDPSAVAANAALDQTTRFAYDAAGRVVQHTDAMGGVQQYGYDGLGNRVTLIDEKSQTWTSTFDADGRQLTTTSPIVRITTNAVNGNGDLAESSSDVAIVTASTYDGVGNLTQHVDDAGRADARTTVYGYDAAGRVISTQGPAFSSYNYQGANPTNNPPIAAISNGAPVSQKFYDAFGNVVATVDPMGAITYTTYDQANRVAYAVDALGYAMGNVRNAFGDVLVQTRYGAPSGLIGTAPTNASNAPTTAAVGAAVAALAHGADRVTTSDYDALGRTKSTVGATGYFLDTNATFSGNVIEASVVPTTTYRYDAFGDLVLAQQVANQALGLRASSFHYFDNAGQETDTVDPSGYQTHRSFDSFGNVTQTLEYANAKTGSWDVGVIGTTPTASANDRTTTDVFDRLNRRTSETRTVDYSTTDDGAITGHALLTSWGYDAQGHVTRVTDPAGAVTLQSYDALGRVRAVLAPPRASTIDGSTLVPVTEYAYDAFGAATMVTQRATSATGVAEFTGVWTSGGANGYTVAANAGDRITRTLYDSAGHAFQVDDPMAASTAFHNSWRYYDADGRLVYSRHYNAGNDGAWFNVDQGVQYDANGQVVLEGHANGTAAAAHEVYSNTRYNAFGDVTDRGTNGTYYEHSFYDNNGNRWLTNAGSGVYTAFVYDLRGNVSSQLTSQGVDHIDVDLSTMTSIQSVMGQAANLKANNSIRDLKGNIVRIDEATRSTTDGGLTARLGATTWGTIVSGTLSSPNKVTLGFNALNALGSGQVQFTIVYKAGDGNPSTAVVTADSAQAMTSFVASWTPASRPGILSVTSVSIAKKDTGGNWNTLITSSTSGVNCTQLEIDAPDDPRAVVSFTYTKQPSGSPVTVLSPATAGGPSRGLINFGNAYSFNTSTLPAGTYSYQATITSADGAVSSPRTGTFTVNPSATVLGSPQVTQVTPSIFQSFDRWGNLLTASDARSAAWITSYQYNGNNQVIAMTQPAPLSGIAVPVTQYYYDQQGHRIATKDANSAFSRQVFDAAGQLVETDGHPTATTKVKATNAYDIFGELVQAVSGNGYDGNGAATANIASYTTRNTYDALGELLSVQHGTGSTGNVTDIIGSTATVVNERQAYTYDADGHRLSSWDDTAGAGHLATTYSYDAAGQLTSTTLPLISGKSTASTSTYVFDDFGFAKSHTDADQNVETWSHDFFGRLTGHVDYTTAIYKYAYDNAGQLSHQTSTAGQDLRYSYDTAGQMTSIDDAALHETTTYTYDLAGNHLQESTSVNGAYYQDNRLAYDNIGRLVDSSDGQIHVSFQYDGVGNRKAIQTHVIESGAMLSTGYTSPADATRVFTYDGMNRQVHVNWQSDSVQGQNGHTLTYDADGNRLSDVFMNNLVTVTGTATTSGTGPDGAPIFTGFTNQSYAAANALVTELYTYDADDRLTKTLFSLKNGSTAGWIQIDSRSYDTAGRMKTKGAMLPRTSSSSGGTTLYQWFNSINPSTGLVGLHLDSEKVTNFTYDEDGELLNETAGTVAIGQFSVDYTYDAAGNNKTNTLTTTFRDAGGYRHTTSTANTLDAKAADGAYQVTTQTSQQFSSQETAGGGTSTSPTTTANTSSHYDVNGHVDASSGQFGVNYAYVNDAQGNVLSRSGTLRNLVVDGESLGQYGVDGSASVAGDQQVFRMTFGFQSMEDTSLQTGTGVVTASDGETLQQVAAAAYGDASLWRRIASLNGFGAEAHLHAGQRIIIAGNSGMLFNSVGTASVSDTGNMIASVAARTVVGDPTLSDEEKDAYYQDAYGKVRPNPFGWKGGGDGGSFIQGTDASSSTDFVGSGASLDAEVTRGAISDAIASGASADEIAQSIVSSPTFMSHVAPLLQPFRQTSQIGMTGAAVADLPTPRGFGDRNINAVGDLSGSSAAAMDGSRGMQPNAGNAIATADPLGEFIQANMPTWADHAGAVGYLDYFGDDELPISPAAPANSTAKHAASDAYVQKGLVTDAPTNNKHVLKPNDTKIDFKNATLELPLVTNIPILGPSGAVQSDGSSPVYAISKNEVYWYADGRTIIIPEAFYHPTVDQLVSDPSNPFMQHAQMGRTLTQGAFLVGSVLVSGGVGAWAYGGVAAATAGTGYSALAAGGVSAFTTDAVYQTTQVAASWATNDYIGNSKFNAIELATSPVLGLYGAELATVWGEIAQGLRGGAVAVGSSRTAAIITNAGADGASFGAGSRALGGEVTTIPRNGSRVVLQQNYVSEIGNVACGPTSCAMVMNDRGLFVNISHLAQDAGLVPDVGTDVLGLSDALRQNGVSAARASLKTTIDDLAISTANGNSAIAHLKLNGDVGHFVVVDGVTTRGGQAVVAVRDPLDGQFFVPVGEFKTKFSGQAVLTDGLH